MSRKLSVMCCISLLCLVIHAQREVKRFDREWRFARYGLQADGTRRVEPSSLDQPFADDEQWRVLDLPHDWGIEGPFRNDLEGCTAKLPWKGIGWYRKHFVVPANDKGRQLYLDFDGAMANAEVWINGYKVGDRPYGYISFRVNLTPHIRWGEDNVVAVRLDTEKLGSRWYPGAGIYRHVRLVKTASVHVAHWGVYVTTPNVSLKEATAMVQVKLQNNRPSAMKCSYTVDLYELRQDDRPGRRVASHPGVSMQLPAGECTTDSVRLTVSSPKLWDLEHTHRYLARVSVYDGKKCIDVLDTPFGIRTIEFTHDNGFMLNGKRVQIQGTCNHHDLGALGAAFNIVAQKRQLQILKSFGCNALRTSHNPPAPELLDLADKMGFLVMDEAFDCWGYGKRDGDYGSLFLKWHQEDIESLICRDRNHPSVIMWSTGNEVQEQYFPETGMARHLTEVVHRFDRTRPATFGASYPSRSAMNGTELQVDVHGMNYAAGVYGGPYFYGEFLSKDGHEHISGYASESSSTMSSRGEYYPRRFHVTSYDTQEPGWGGLVDQEFAALERYPGICGEFVWTGFDYLGEPTPFNSDNTVLLNHAAAMDSAELAKVKAELEQIDKDRPTSRSSYFGIVDLAGFPKDRYYLYQSHWMPDLPMVHILPHWNFPDRVGQKTPVYVYTSGDEAELFLNGKSMGHRKKHPFEYRLRWEDVVYEPGELKVIAYKNGKPWADTVVKTTGEAVQVRLTPDKTTIHADGEDLVFVRVSFLDRDGNEVPVAEPRVTCTVTGAGQVLATDNGDPTCLIPFHQATRPAFNGLLLAIIKAYNDGRGILTFTAEAEGVGKAELKIRIK